MTEIEILAEERDRLEAGLEMVPKPLEDWETAWRSGAFSRAVRTDPQLQLFIKGLDEQCQRARAALKLKERG